MWDAIVEYAVATNIGIFGLLFIALLISVSFGIKWIFNKNDERERRYIRVIEQQAEGLKIVENVQRDVREIKDYVLRR